MKTPGQIASELYAQGDTHHLPWELMTIDCRRWWENYASAFLSASDGGWVKVGTALPEDRRFVWAYRPAPHEEAGRAWYCAENGTWSLNGYSVGRTVTHWRELPSPPPLPEGA